ncbi:hypothetical protein HanPI659440_Chr13g0519161 [Helianthus annuus]|nr:hypothetical protein HanPI659440_Chr13g0519161 [Helianthus annuus]
MRNVFLIHLFLALPFHTVQVIYHSLHAVLLPDALNSHLVFSIRFPFEQTRFGQRRSFDFLQSGLSDLFLALPFHTIQVIYHSLHDVLRQLML